MAQRARQRDGRPASSAACRDAQARDAGARTGWRASASRGFGDRYPHQLSGGMRKRVALAQTLILDPDIILMDEPFSALDIQTRQLMENEVLELWAAKRKAVLFITHDLDEAIALSRPRRRAVGRARRRIRSANSRSTCRGRATSPRSACTPRFVELHDAIWARAARRSAEGLSAAEARRLMDGIDAAAACALWQLVPAGR